MQSASASTVTPGALLAAAFIVLLTGCGGADPSSPGPTPASPAAGAGHDVVLQTGTADPDWAPGETPGARAMPPSDAGPAVKPVDDLWTADGRARVTLPEDRPADTAGHWSGQRYATRVQLAHEQTVAAPYTVVIDADDEAAVETGLQYAQTVGLHGGGKAQMGVFVRSRHPALAARLAERLTLEQGWVNVFVVF